MKRAVGMEELIDLFCGKQAETMSCGEIRRAANRLIQKHNLQCRLDFEREKIAVFRPIRQIEEEREVEKWLMLKDYLFEKIRGTEYEELYSCRVNERKTAKQLQQQFHLSKSKYYGMFAKIYRIAERYLYYQRLLQIEGGKL